MQNITRFPFPLFAKQREPVPLWWEGKEGGEVQE